MFGRRRGYRRGGMGGGGGFGLFLLAMQVMNLFSFLSRSNEFFPVTLAVLAVNIVAFLRIGGIAWPSIRQACISVQGVWFQGQWKRILYASFFHASDFHLYYNMASFIWKAISLERVFGSGYFLYMVCVFSLLTNLLYLAINFALAEILDQWSYVQSCAVGFSGVIFALKVVTTHLQPRGMTMIMGVVPVPMKLACWAELVLVSVLFPNVSFIGHLSGILVGLAFVNGPLKIIMDIPLSALSDFSPNAPSGPNQTGQGQSYTYRAATTGYRPPESQSDRQRRPPTRPHPSRSRTHTSYTYASGATGYSQSEHDVGGATEEAELQEAIRRSLEHDNSADLAESDKNLQSAIERSLVDCDDPRPPTEAQPSPPPYNPDFAPPGIQSTETEVVSDPPTNNVQQTNTEPLRRRHVHNQRENEQSSSDSSSNLDRVRAARLKRFT